MGDQNKKINELPKLIPHHVVRFISTEQDYPDSPEEIPIKEEIIIEETNQEENQTPQQYATQTSDNEHQKENQTQQLIEGNQMRILNNRVVSQYHHEQVQSQQKLLMQPQIQIQTEPRQQFFMQPQIQEQQIQTIPQQQMFMPQQKQEQQTQIIPQQQYFIPQQILEQQIQTIPRQQFFMQSQMREQQQIQTIHQQQDFTQPSTSRIIEKKVYATNTILTYNGAVNDEHLQSTLIQMDPIWLQERIKKIGLHLYLEACKGYPNFHDAFWQPLMHLKHSNVIKFKNIMDLNDWHCLACNQLLLPRSEEVFVPEIQHIIEPVSNYEQVMCHLCKKDIKSRMDASMCAGCVYHYALFGTPNMGTLVTVPCPRIQINTPTDGRPKRKYNKSNTLKKKQHKDKTVNN